MNSRQRVVKSFLERLSASSRQNRETATLHTHTHPTWQLLPQAGRRGSSPADVRPLMSRLSCFAAVFAWPDIARLKLYQSCCLNIYENGRENNARPAAGDRRRGASPTMASPTMEPQRARLSRRGRTGGEVKDKQAHRGRGTKRFLGRGPLNGRQPEGRGFTPRR